MLRLALAAALAHTPKHFISSTCNQKERVLEKVNVSQVSYMKAVPACNINFTIKGKCNFNEISLHRFSPKHSSDAFVEIISASDEVIRLTETNNTKKGEPFTTTQYVTTITRSNFDTKFDSCTVRVGATTSAKLQLVVGKSEEWWLFLTIPFYAPRIQWGWAFSSVSYWYWPYLLYLSLLFVILGVLSCKYGTEDKNSFVAVLALIISCFVVDYLVPLIMVFRKLNSYWPPGALWNVFVFYKFFRYAEIVYLIWCIETGSTFKSLDKWKWEIALTANFRKPAAGPPGARTAFAPVSITPSSYFLDLFVWSFQLCFLFASFAIHTASCLPLLFFVVLFRLWDYNKNKMLSDDSEENEKPSGVSKVNQNNSSRFVALGVFIQAKLFYFVSRGSGPVAAFAMRNPFFVYVFQFPLGMSMLLVYFLLFPMYFACRLQETLPARTYRLLFFKAPDSYSQVSANQTIEEEVSLKSV